METFAHVGSKASFGGSWLLARGMMVRVAVGLAAPLLACVCNL